MSLPATSRLLRRALQPTIARKVGFLLVLLTLGGFSALATFYWHVTRSANDAAFVDVAGRQRMTSAQLLTLVHAVRLDEASARGLLRETLDDFGRRLAALEAGDRFDGYELPSPSGETRRALAATRALLEEARVPLLHLADPALPAASGAIAYRSAEDLVPQLTQAANRVVTAYESEIRARDDRTFLALAGICAFDVLLLAGGLVLTRRYVSRPIRQMRESTQRVRAGDFGHRVPVVTRDELANLAEAFNDMTADLDRLLAAERAAGAEAESARRLLAEQNDRLRELDHLKDEFVATVSHELRTPLTSIRGYLELVLGGDVGDMTEEQRRFLAVADRNARRLVRLVSDLLLVAQIQGGTLPLEPRDVDLAALAAECVEGLRPSALARGVELSVWAPRLPRLRGDDDRLAQLLDNLVSNAVKFTPPGGRVEVSVSERSGRAAIEIRDTGVGIPAAEQGRLFERFFRASTATANAVQGTGLGLAIADAIARAHGGSIDLVSEEGAGTTVRVELPLAGTPAHDAADLPTRGEVLVTRGNAQAPG